MNEETTITKKELAARWQLSERSIERFVLNGMPHAGGRLNLRFDVALAEGRRVQQRTRPHHAAKRPTEEVSVTIPPQNNPQAVGDFTSLGEAERRRVLADAQHRELKLAVAMGRLVDAGAAEAAWSEIVGDIRHRLLALPAKLTQRLFGCANRAEFQATLKAEIADVLQVIGHGK